MLSFNAHKAANLIGLMRAIVVGFLQKKTNQPHSCFESIFGGAK
jgi:hypothetical protein